MDNKKQLNVFRLTFLNLKSMKFIYFVPLVFLFIVIPFFVKNYTAVHGYGYHTKFLVFSEMERYIPFMASWWIIFGLREYVEGEGRELLRVYKNSLISDFFVIFTWYIIHVFILITLLQIFFANYWIDFIIMTIQGLVFASATFLLMAKFNTIAIPFIVNIFYEIFLIYSNPEGLGFINMLKEDSAVSFNEILLPYLPLFAVSLILIYLGNYFYKKNTAY